MFLRNKSVKAYLRKGYDLNLIGRIQPQNPNFKENDSYWKAGDGYHKALHIPHDGFPEKGLPDFWGAELTAVPGASVFRFFEHGQNQKLSAEASRAISNLTNSSNIDPVSDVEDAEAAEKLLGFRAVVNGNIPAKKMGVSFYIAADSEEALMEKQRDIQTRLPQYTVKSNDGMQDIEFHMPFIPASLQPSLPTRRKGQVVSVLDLGGGYPFNHTTLMDDRGVYLGSTRTDGAVVFNLLQEDAQRHSPTMIVAGDKHSGKHRLLAKQIDHLFAMGHTILNIDLDGSLRKLTESQGGLYISISPSKNDYHLNPLEVVPTKLGEDGISDDQIASFKAHQHKLKVFAMVKDSTIQERDLNLLNSAVAELYHDFGLWEVNPDLQKSANLHITDVVSEDYPLLSHLVERLKGLADSAQARNERLNYESYDRLFQAFWSILDDYRHLDRSSEFQSIDNEKVVTFDLSNLESDPQFLNIQLFQILNLIAAQTVKNGKNNGRLINAGDERPRDDYNHCIIRISGAEKLFDPRYTESLKYLADMVSSISNNYAAVILEMSSLQRILISSQIETSDPYVLATRELFARVRYRLFSQVDVTTLKPLANALHGEMTPSELESLRHLQQNQFFLNIAGVKNIAFNLELSYQGDMVEYGLPYAEDVLYKHLG